VHSDELVQSLYVLRTELFISVEDGAPFIGNKATACAGKAAQRVEDLKRLFYGGKLDVTQTRNRQRTMIGWRSMRR
jgi:hypothetical protein